LEKKENFDTQRAWKGVPCSRIVIRQTNIDRAQVFFGRDQTKGKEWQKKKCVYASSVCFFFLFCSRRSSTGSASKHQAPMQIEEKRKRSKKRNYRKPISNARFQMVGSLEAKSKKHDGASMPTKPP
jgi:hypothetical protein